MLSHTHTPLSHSVISQMSHARWGRPLLNCVCVCVHEGIEPGRRYRRKRWQCRSISKRKSHQLLGFSCSFQLLSIMFCKWNMYATLTHAQTRTHGTHRIYMRVCYTSIAVFCTHHLRSSCTPLWVIYIRLTGCSSSHCSRSVMYAHLSMLVCVCIFVWNRACITGPLFKYR